MSLGNGGSTAIAYNVTVTTVTAISEYHTARNFEG